MKRTLKYSDYEFPTECVFIRCNRSLPSMVFFLNRDLHCRFFQTDAYPWEHKDENYHFEFFEENYSENEPERFLIANWCEKDTNSKNSGIFAQLKERVYLISDYKSADAILLIRGENMQKYVANLVKKIHAMPQVEFALQVNYEELKSKKNLIV